MNNLAAREHGEAVQPGPPGCRLIFRAARCIAAKSSPSSGSKSKIVRSGCSTSPVFAPAVELDRAHLDTDENGVRIHDPDRLVSSRI